MTEEIETTTAKEDSVTGSREHEVLPADKQPLNVPQRSVNLDVARILEEVKLPERHTPLQSEQKAATTAEGEVPPTKEDLLSTDPETVATPTEQPTDQSPVTSLHTMKTDLLGIIKERKMSVVRAASLEAEKRRGLHDEVVTPKQRLGLRGVVMAISIVILIVLGIAVAYAGYSATHGVNAAPQNTPSILFAERSFALPLNQNQSGQALKAEIENAITSQQGPTGSITQLVPVVAATDTSQRLATLQEFLQSLGTQPPTDLVRALSPQFFFGVHQADVPAPVFVIPVVSYDRAFAGMLQWESTMDADLTPLAKPVPDVMAGPNGVPVARTFQDMVQRNYDVRALEDDSGNVILYYSFPTQNLLIIATSLYTFPEVLSRLQAARKL